jgi:hypothetical protein
LLALIISKKANSINRTATNKKIHPLLPRGAALKMMNQVIRHVNQQPVDLVVLAAFLSHYTAAVTSDNAVARDRLFYILSGICCNVQHTYLMVYDRNSTLGGR